MTGGQLAITLIVVILVGAGAAAAAVLTQPDITPIKNDIAALRGEIQDLKIANQAEVEALSARIDDVKAGMTIYPALGEVTKRIDDIETKLSSLEAKIQAGPAVSSTPGAESSDAGKKDEPIGKFLKDLSENPDNPQKAVQSILKSEMGQNLLKIGKNNMIQQLKNRLNLDDKQMERAKEILENGFGDAIKVFTDENLTQEQIQAEVDKIRENADAAMREILDDQQYQQYKEMSNRQFRFGGGGMFGGGGRGNRGGGGGGQGGGQGGGN